MQTKGRLGHLVLLVVLVVCAIAGAVQGREHAPDFADHDPGAIRASGKGPDANWIDFVTGLEPPAYQEGRIFWDKDNGCLALYPEISAPIMQIGQELWIRVKNEETATMTNGTVVYLNPPNTGKDPVAKLADADIATMSPVIGVVTHDIPPDSNGYVTCNGLVRNLNTSGMVAGGKVFLSSIPGSFTVTVPNPPASSIIVGYCLKAHETAGLLFVRVWLNGSIEPAVFDSTAYFSRDVTFASGATQLSKMTNLGGHAVAMYNGSGVIASAGNVVMASSTAGYFTLTPADNAGPIGVVYKEVAPGALGYVVVSGVGYVKMASTEVATSGGLLLVDDGEVGRAMSATAIPPTTQTEHNKELGHCISTQSTPGGLVKAVLHFN